jgi:E3 ubiquitin-protein ligase HERC2
MCVFRFTFRINTHQCKLIYMLLQVKGLAGYRVTQVACGSRDAQTLAITDDGTVWSWGDGDFGKLGRGGSDGSLQPEKIDSLNGKGICQVECGAQFSLALSQDGIIYTWGKGDYYRLGHGTDTHVRKPQPIESLKDVKVIHVAVGALHCVAVTDQGKVFSWGDNDHGQLGTGSTNVSKKPTPISVLDNFRISRVACGSSHTFAWTKPIETVPSVEHQPVMYSTSSDPIGTATVLQSSSSGGFDTLSPSDIILKHRPTLSKIILAIPDNPRRQEAIHPLLQALQISYARDAVVSALAGDIDTSTEGELGPVTSDRNHQMLELASVETVAVDTLGSTADSLLPEECDMDSDPLHVDDFIQLLTEGDGRLLLDLLKLAVAGRVNETGRVALSHTLKLLGKTRPEVAEMLLELCVTELEDVAVCTEASPFTAQPVMQESPHPYPDNCTLTGIVRIPGAESLRVEFDRHCSTERRHDPLIIADAAGRVQSTKSGREWSDWSSEVIVQGDELRWRFTSDNSVNGWGWKFTVYPGTATKEALDTLPDRVIQSKPSIDLVSCLLDFRLESRSRFDVVPRLASALGACARLCGLEPTQRLWALQRLRKLLVSQTSSRTSWECALKGGAVAAESGPLTMSLVPLIQSLPNMLLKQYEYEENLIKNGKHLIHTSFFKGLVALAADVTLDHLSVCQDKAKWNWLKRYCAAFRVASSINKRLTLPKDFLEEVRVKLQGLTALGEMPNYEHENHTTFRRDHDEQLMTWLQRKPDDWTLTSGGSSVLYGWGHNHRGQLGGIDGSKVKTPTVLENIAALRPIQITGGEQTLFVVTRDGKVYSTGYGAYGRLGIGGTDSVGSPRLIQSFQDVVIKKVAVHSGGKHCLALSGVGLVYSWGEGDDGKLGHGNRSNCEQPQMIEALKDVIISDITCGGSHSACISKNGELFTWGKGRYGRLGHGDSDDQTKPKLVQFFNGMRVVCVACGSGDSQTMAVTDDGQVWSWGDGDYGKLGRGGSDGCKSPKSVTDLAGKGVVKVECGSQFSVALTKSGEVYTWGKGDYYRLGHGTDSHQRRPKLIEELKDKLVTDVTTGSLHCCCCTANGEVYTWGDNDEGQLGDNSTEGVQKPKLVSSLKGKFIDRVACGSAHTVAWSTTQPSSACRLPDEVPMEYNHLRDLDVKVLRNRLVLLNHFSDLVSSCIAMFGVEKQITAGAAGNEVSFDGLRCLISPAVKENVFKKVVQNTMARDRPHGPVIEVNRLQVKRSRTKSGLTGSEGSRSVFGQVCSRMVTAGPDSLFLPQRVWKVKFVGESVDDCGGGYSESISEMCDELHRGVAPLLIPTPNGREETGVNQDCYILNPQARSPQHINMFRFLGILCGIAIRTGQPLSISLAPPVWKQLAGMSLTVGDLVEIDKEFVPSLVYIRNSSEEDLKALDLPFTTPSATGQEVQLSTKYKTVTPANRVEYVQMALRYRYHEFDSQVAAVREGMAKVVPVPLLSLFVGAELEMMVCGNPEINVDVLKTIATYKGISPSSQLVQWFWTTLENFTVNERSLFLRFVWGRTRLPRTVSDFKGRDFVVQVMEKHGFPDDYLPEAYTCFFLVKLPRYSSQEVLREKLKYAIYFCKSIDTDDYARVHLTTDATLDDSDLEDETLTE